METCHSVSLLCKGTNILIFVICGQFLPAGMICTTTDTISIPVGEMYLHARVFCALAHTSSIPMGAINFYMQERFLHSLIPLLFKCWLVFYSHGCNVTPCLCSVQRRWYNYSVVSTPLGLYPQSSIAQDTFQRSPSSIPLIDSVYQIPFTSSIGCHLRPQVLKTIHFV